ncbi:MAG TPA: AAA family ATPase [Mycobacteriales bacterium]|nr:AAA family ATPase [Mycobacteriales bacterium]
MSIMENGGSSVEGECSVLIIIGGLPATGKTTVSRAVARELGGVHLRIDTIEQAIVRCGFGTQPLGPVGYDVAYALAEDYLKQGLTVVAESVNPLKVTRSAWRAAATAAGVPSVDVEVVCSDPVEHERRATTRVVDIPDLRIPTWQEIRDREYESWTTERIVLDTAVLSVPDCVDRLRKAVADGGVSGSG